MVAIGDDPAARCRPGGAVAVKAITAISVRQRGVERIGPTGCEPFP
jgi:hypothetical protein